MFCARALVFACAVLAGLAPQTAATAYVAHWTADASGNLLAAPVPDYSALRYTKVALNWTLIDDLGPLKNATFAQMCPLTAFGEILYGPNTEADCFARFSDVQSWRLSEETNRVAQEYFFQRWHNPELRGNLHYVAQWDAKANECRVAVARGCLNQQDLCDFSLQYHDICLAEVSKLHVSRAAHETLFDLQRPCARQFKVRTQYYRHDDMQALRQEYYYQAWSTNVSARPTGETERPHFFEFEQAQLPHYHKQGEGICIPETNEQSIWKVLPSPVHTAGECPHAIRAFLAPYTASTYFVSGWVDGGELPTTWLDGWPLVWALEQRDDGNYCRWLHLQNVTHPVVQALTNEADCRSLTDALWVSNATVYHKHLALGSEEAMRHTNVHGDTPEIQVVCPPGEFSRGSSWSAFLAGGQACERCPAYTYKSTSAGNGRCEPCPTGTGTNATGSTSFAVCETVRPVYQKATAQDMYALPIQDQLSEFLDFGKLQSRVRELCMHKPGCNLQAAMDEAQCALQELSNHRYKDTVAANNARHELLVPGFAGRRLGLIVPENVMTQAAEISVDVLPEPDASIDLMHRALNADASLIQVGTRQTYRPHGLRFGAPVTLLLHVSPALLPEGAVPQVYYLNTSGIELVWELVPGSVYDPSTGEISVLTTHFSDYAPVVVMDASSTPAPPLAPVVQAYSFPSYDEASGSVYAAGDLVANPMPVYHALLEHNVSHIDLQIRAPVVVMDASSTPAPVVQAYSFPSYDEASWSVDAAGDLVANPMPDYHALLEHNVSHIDLQIHDTSLCRLGAEHAYIFKHVTSKHECRARFKEAHTWTQITVHAEQVAQEYHMQGDLGGTKGELHYIAQWDALEEQCTLGLARGCVFSPDVCQDSIRRTDRCLKELDNMHVTQAADVILFNLQTPCANQFKLPSWYATRDHVADYMSSFYHLAWNAYPMSRPPGVTAKPNQFAQVPPPKYTNRGHGFCDVERAYTNVWSSVSGLYSRGDCAMVIRKTLSLLPYTTRKFVGGWPFGGDLPASWLDGWPLVWAFEETGPLGTCHWLNLQNVTSVTVGKLLNETECSSLSSNWKAVNITVYEKHLQNGSVEHDRFFNIGTAADHDIQIRCPPGQSASGSSWTDFANGAQVCMPCPPYTYKDEGGASGRCKPCPIGLGSDAVGHQSASVCDLLRSDAYKYDDDGDGDEVFAIPIDEPPSAFMNWREERKRVSQLCGTRAGCDFANAIREVRCALIKKDDKIYKEAMLLANVPSVVQVEDPGKRRRGVSIPANALAADTNISVSVAPEPTLSDDLALDDENVLQIVGATITYEPHGMQFARPVTLILHANKALVPDAVTPQVYYLNTSGTELVWELVPDSEYNASTGEISVTTTHFSDYAPVVYMNAASTPAPAETNAATTPAPAETNASSTTTAQTETALSKSKGLTIGAIICISVGALFVTAVVYLAVSGQNMDMKPYSEPQQPGDHLLGEGTYYAPVTYAYPTYSV